MDRVRNDEVLGKATKQNIILNAIKTRNLHYTGQVMKGMTVAGDHLGKIHGQKSR